MLDPFKGLGGLSLPEQATALQQMKAELYRASLYATSKYLLGYKDVNHETHGDMIEALEDDNEKKLIVMPRGTFKSSVACVSYPIWRLLKDPNLRVLIDSEVYTNSKNFLREISTHFETNQGIRDLFGEQVGSTWNEGEITLATRTVIKKEASVTASGIGAEKTGQHYDIIVCDDLNSPTNSKTPDARQKVIDHYQYLSAILDPGGTLVLIGTRYAALDAIGFVLENEIGLKIT